MGHNFYLKNHLQTSFLSFGIWQVIVSKINDVNLSLQGKQLVIFIASDRIKLLSNILNF